VWAKAARSANDHEHLGAFGDRNAYSDERPLQIEQQDGALKLRSRRSFPKRRATARKFRRRFRAELDVTQAVKTIGCRWRLIWCT